MIKLINKILFLLGFKLVKLNGEIMDGLLINNPGRLAKHLGVKTEAADYVTDKINSSVFDGEIRRYNYQEYFSTVRSHLIRKHVVDEYIEDIKTIFDYLTNYYKEYFNKEDSKRFEKLMAYYKYNNLSFPL